MSVTKVTHNQKSVLLEPTLLNKHKLEILENRMLEIKLSKRNKGVVVPGSGANLMNEIVSPEQQMNLL